jgi:hypothetical protein
LLTFFRILSLLLSLRCIGGEYHELSLTRNRTLLTPAVNGFKDQFNCHKFTVDDIVQRIRSVSNEMETKSLLEEAGLKTGTMQNSFLSPK